MKPPLTTTVEPSASARSASSIEISVTLPIPIPERGRLALDGDSDRLGNSAVERGEGRVVAHRPRLMRPSVASTADRICSFHDAPPSPFIGTNPGIAARGGHHSAQAAVVIDENGLPQDSLTEGRNFAENTQNDSCIIRTRSKHPITPHAVRAIPKV